MSYRLLQGPGGLRLISADDPVGISANFVTGANAHRRRFGGGRGQAIARACGLKAGRNPTIIDATAGLGGDAFVLASLGCEVHMIERSATIHALLDDALTRALENAETRTIATRMHLYHADALHRLATLQQETRAEVIHLDPMFPERRKSAAVKKAMRGLKDVVGEDADAERLLVVARATGARRVAVKRPAKAAPVGDQQADAVISGKTTRYDLYLKG